MFVNVRCAAGCGGTCAGASSAPATWPGQALARTTAVPRSSQASRPLSGQARGGVSGSPLQTRQGTVRAHAGLKSLID